MGMVINPSRFSVAGGGGPVSTVAPTPIALVYRTTATSVTDANAVTYTAESYDPSGVIAVSATTMTIPSSGLYRLFSVSNTSSGATGTRARKAGADFIGAQAMLAENTTPRWASGISSIVSLSASDAMTTVAYGGTTNHGTNGQAYNAFGLERLEATTQYALVRKSADQTSFTTGNVTFDTEVADVGGWFDSSSSNERLTVFGSLTRVRVIANVEVDPSATANIIAEITKNGSSGVVGLPARLRRSVASTGLGVHNLATPPINVTGGDYFSLRVDSDVSSSVLNTTGTWFSIEEVPAAVKSCLVYNSSGQTITTSDAALTWDSEDHDPDGMHSTSSNTSRLTVPSGCTYARVFFHVKGQMSSGARVQAQVMWSGGTAVGTAIDDVTGVTGKHQLLSGVSAWMPVSSGQYFELVCLCSTGTVTTTGGWFAMECI